MVGAGSAGRRAVPRRARAEPAECAMTVVLASRFDITPEAVLAKVRERIARQLEGSSAATPGRPLS